MKEKPVDIDNILENYPSEPRFLISLLQDVQANYNYISEENLNLVCDHVGIPVSQAWSVTTFYKSFSLEPRGEHEIKVCLGTACHLKGGQRLVENLSRKLKLEPGNTTSDLKFTLETVNCLGACAIAPVTVIDDKYHGRMTSRKMDKIIKQYSND